MLLLFLPLSLAYHIPILQAQAPYLTLWNEVPVDWGSNLISALTDTSSAVRVNARGIHFYDHNVHPVTHGMPCLRTSYGLCVVEGGSVIFPETSPPRYWDQSRCGSVSKGRLIVDNPSIYDISVCDLIEAQLDVVFFEDKVYLDHDLGIPQWAYIVMALSTLALVISMGQNIAYIMGDEQASPQPILTECVCFVLIVILLCLNSPWRVWISDHDRFMALLTFAYIIVYLVRHGFDISTTKYVYTFNIITATLILVTARLYCTFETPYASVFYVLLLTRFFHKIHLDREPETFTMVCDSLYAAFHYRLCYKPSFWNPHVSIFYASAILVLCHVVGKITAARSQKVLSKQPPCHESLHIRIGAPFTDQQAQPPAFGAEGVHAGYNSLRLHLVHT